MMGAFARSGVLLLLVGSACLVEAHPLAGEWRLDVAASDDPQDAIEDVVNDIAQLVRTPPRGRHGARPESRRQIQRSILHPLAIPDQIVRIEVTAEDVAFALDGGPQERLRTDGRPMAIDAEHPDARVAEWEATTLWVDRTSPSGTRVTEAWSPIEGGLKAEFEVNNGLFEEPVVFSLIFRAQEPDS